MDPQGPTADPTDSTVMIRPLADMRAIESAASLFDDLWGANRLLPPNVIRAIQHAGGYVFGAYAGDRLLGASVGFLGTHDEDGQTRPVLHSHVTGVRESDRGVGFLLKRHQREWSRQQGLGAVTWTVDPLVARNGWFNFGKLGALGVGYLIDHYGDMDDGVNVGQGSDRLLVVWELTETEPLPRPPAPVLLLTRDPLDRPAWTDAEVGDGAAAYSVQVPSDIGRLRSTTPHRAAEWRQAVRRTMGKAVAAGYVVTAADRDGTYVLTRQP